MKERPILFSGQMVRALLDGSKTQTRRVLKADFMHDPKGSLDAKWYFRGPRAACWGSYETLAELVAQHCPYGQPGDRLWVRETWAAPHSEDARPPRAIQVDQMRIHYAASENRGGLLWRPSIFMPRWASRITLEIVSIRVEKLQDISEADALAEGVREINPYQGLSRAYARSYSVLWESINGPDSWSQNPWVWVIECKRVQP